METKNLRTLFRGGFIIVNRELAYFIAGGVINTMSILYNYYYISNIFHIFNILYF